MVDRSQFRIRRIAEKLLSAAVARNPRVALMLNAVTGLQHHLVVLRRNPPSEGNIHFEQLHLRRKKLWIGVEDVRIFVHYCSYSFFVTAWY